MVDYALLISGNALGEISVFFEGLSVWHFVAAGAAIVAVLVFATR